MAPRLLALVLVGGMGAPWAEGKGGTVFFGGKSWLASWDSSVSEAVRAARPSLVIEPATGYLAGPLLGYQTGDGKWSLSLALMELSDFTQKISDSQVSIVIDATRAETDFAISRSLSNHIKLFGGVKISRVADHLSMQVDLNPYYEGDAKFTLIAPTLGVGVTAKLRQRMVLGLQLGGIHMWVSEYEWLPPFSGGTQSGKQKTLGSIGSNIEANLNFFMSKRWICQAGYRLQTFKSRPKDSETPSPQPYSTDVFQGVILSLVYGLPLWGA